MKKTILTTALAAILLAGMASGAAAARFDGSVGDRYITIEGEILDVRADQRSFTIEDRDDGKRYIFNAQPGEMESIQRGDLARVTAPRVGRLATKITKLEGEAQSEPTMEKSADPDKMQQSPPPEPTTYQTR